MKLRYLFITILALLLSACNLTLAADVTPPPNYVPPTPMPTLGPVYPAEPMNIFNGAKIYGEKCAPCHGFAGLGDGEQGKQLPVRVAAIGLEDIANKAQPAAWYKQVTQGNIERMMPPFASLNDQERWDVVGYAIFLHIDPARIESGKELVTASCADCAAYFSDLERMSALSELDLIYIAKNGNDKIPAFGKDFSDEQLGDVAVYLRSLTLNLGHGGDNTTEATAMPDAAQATSEPSATESAAATEAPAEQETKVGKVTGKVDNQSGADLPSDVKVTLHGYEHSGDMSAGATEVLTLETTLKADGTYEFDNVEINASRIFVAEIILDDMSNASDYMVATPEMSEIALPDIILRASTTELTNLTTENVLIHLDYSVSAQINATVIYSTYNRSDKSVLVKLENDNKEIPFVKAPLSSTLQGFEATQDSAQFVGTSAGDGFYIAPSEQVYGLVMYASLQRNEVTEYSQQFVLPVEKVTVIVPDGVTVSGDALSDDGVQTFPGSNGESMRLQTYTAKNVKAGDTLSFKIEGEPNNNAAQPDETATSNNNLLIGVGAFGIVLIAVGAWLFIRDRNKTRNEDEDDEEDEAGFEDEESALDAIIALDDLHRSGKISDEAYQKRRAELKSSLKK